MLKPIKDHGLLMHPNKERECLGYIMEFKTPSGVRFFDPGMEQLNISRQEMNEHNKLLDKAILDGLENCPVGSGQVFYYIGGQLGTFMGTPVPGDVSVKWNGRRSKLTLQKGNKTFTAWLKQDEEALFLKRVK